MTHTPEVLALPALPGDELHRLLARTLPLQLARRGELLAVQDAESGRLVHANEAMATFLGRPLADLMGRSDAELFDASLATALRAAAQTALAQAEPLLSEHRFDWRGSKHEFEVLRWASPAADPNRRWLCSVWTGLGVERQRESQLRLALTQIEQQQQANMLLQRELADQAMRDPASGLYRRAHFDDQLRREVDLSTREHREFAIVFLEIDPPGERVLGFGEAGEHRVLEAVGRLLRSGTRAMDASCRHDRRLFAVLLSGVGLATAHARMEGLRRKCAAHIVVLEGQEFGFTVSMGVASFPHTAHTQDALVAACESALAEARRRGGNHVTLAAIRFAGA